MRFLKFYFFVFLLISGVTVARPLSLLLPLVNKPLKHTNRMMDTVVTIVLSHNDTSKVAVGGGEGAHGHKYCHRPIISLLKEKQINSEHSNTLMLLPTYTVVELRAVML